MKRKVFSIVMALFFMIGCAGISLKSPTTQIIIQDVTQTTGYMIAKKNSQLGKELMEYTKIFLAQSGQELVNFQSWKKFIAKSLVEDEFLKLIVKKSNENLKKSWLKIEKLEKGI